MTQPLAFRKQGSPVKPIVPQVSDRDRVRAELRRRFHTPEQIDALLRGYDLVCIVERQLGIIHK